MLFRKYVGADPVDLDRLHAAILREKQAAESGALKVSPGLLTELRSDLAYVGNIRNLERFFESAFRDDTGNVKPRPAAPMVAIGPCSDPKTGRE